MDEYRGKPIKALEFGTDFVFGDRVTAEGRVFIIPDEARVWPFGYTDGPYHCAGWRDNTFIAAAPINRS